MFIPLIEPHSQSSIVLKKWDMRLGLREGPEGDTGKADNEDPRLVELSTKVSRACSGIGC